MHDAHHRCRVYRVQRNRYRARHNTGQARRMTREHLVKHANSRRDQFREMGWAGPRIGETLEHVLQCHGRRLALWCFEVGDGAGTQRGKDVRFQPMPGRFVGFLWMFWNR